MVYLTVSSTSLDLSGIAQINIMNLKCEPVVIDKQLIIYVKVEKFSRLSYEQNTLV